jgi:crotonobetainyl-CoA:carnitine CoA-transferase CaiB-like acyl-CoA transferase
LHRAVRINNERETDPLPPPAPGEHTDAVLAELGFPQAEIAELRQARVI